MVGRTTRAKRQNWGPTYPSWASTALASSYSRGQNPAANLGPSGHTHSKRSCPIPILLYPTCLRSHPTRSFRIPYLQSVLILQPPGIISLVPPQSMLPFCYFQRFVLHSLNSTFKFCLRCLVFVLGLSWHLLLLLLQLLYFGQIYFHD